MSSSPFMDDFGKGHARVLVDGGWDTKLLSALLEKRSLCNACCVEAKLFLFAWLSEDRVLVLKEPHMLPGPNLSYGQSYFKIRMGLTL